MKGISDPMVTLTDYKRAESYLPSHVNKRLFAASVRPRWTGSGDRFWYAARMRDGKRFVLVDPDSGSKEDVFDHEQLASALSTASGQSVDADALPFGDITLTGKDKGVEFNAFGQRWQCDLAAYRCSQVDVDDPDELWSPQHDRAAFVRDHDLWIRRAATGVETRLTHDGRPGWDYATALPSPLPAAGVKTANPWPKPGPAGIWSPNGRRLLTHRIDSRTAGTYTLVQSVPTDGTIRPRSFDYIYPLPGEENIATAELMVFDVETGGRIEVGVPPLDQLYFGTPLPMDAEAGRGRSMWWSEDGARCYVLRTARGYRKVTLYEIDAATGGTRVLVEEEDETPVDPGITLVGSPNIRVLAGGTEVLWYSQRDGWGHLYLYDAGTGELIRQLTSGPWVVVEVLHVDESARFVYIVAVGREPGRDRYERLLYRVPLDGGEPVLLTPGEGSFSVSFAPSGRWFVTTSSRIDTPPVTELRRAEGEAVARTLETADLSELTANGWTFPERFTATARDGVTEISGILIRPSTFDPARRYPVIDSVYGGPGMNRAPVSFAEAGDSFWQAQAIAELGFVVVMVDGLGMPHRSKAYRDVAYRNLADAGLPDHITALRQLAETRPYLDLDRVGIYGHSAGGYASCRAMFAYPDFYRVGVSSAGNHDHRLDKAWWIERYMGYPVGTHYGEQANPAHAANLRGKLLLAHGEMDENIHPASTLAVVNALVEAGKDFDLLILPNRSHAFGNDPYFVRRRWDYLVRHLAGVEPPSYAITGP
jgi:dipeptidyl-peptidase 4